MLRPSIYAENLWDEFFDDAFFSPLRTAAYASNNSAAEMMRTDVKEHDSEYEITMNLPGITKENVKAELKNGYLTIAATTDSNNDQKDENGRYIRRERYSGSFSRAFYVGEDVKQEDIKARFENGTLILTVPKMVQQPAVEENHYIAIE
ncbi:MAG: Hsp20/alpha crystallin family protein [Lachnospiraceae bacterium]|nr:Hsp20/alpha crystallin family protein [Lachnospiraceae bacterium]